MPLAGKVYDAEERSVLNVAPSVEPCTESVWSRAPQADGNASLRSVTVAAAPRSICTHCGKTLLADSQ